MFRPVKALSLDKFVTAGLVALGLAIMLGGLRLKVGYLFSPEPGFFPFVAGSTIAALALVQLFAGASDLDTTEPARHWPKALALGAALLVYTAILEAAGFIIATALLATIVMRLSFPQSWPKTVCIAVAASAATYAIFCLILKVDLPGGAMFELVRG